MVFNQELDKSLDIALKVYEKDKDDSNIATQIRELIADITPYQRSMIIEDYNYYTKGNNDFSHYIDNKSNSRNASNKKISYRINPDMQGIGIDREVITESGIETTSLFLSAIPSDIAMGKKHYMASFSQKDSEGNWVESAINISKYPIISTALKVTHYSDDRKKVSVTTSLIRPKEYAFETLEIAPNTTEMEK